MRCDFIHRLTDVTHTRKSKEAWLLPILEYNGGVVVVAAAAASICLLPLGVCIMRKLALIWRKISRGARVAYWRVLSTKLRAFRLEFA